TASSFRSSEFPHVAVNPINGDVFVTYNNKGAGTDKADIFLVVSTNGGANWSVPAKINDDVTTTDQWQPTIAITPNGSRLGIFYYSRQEDPANNLFKFYGRVGSVSGSTVTFDASFAVSDVASLPEFGRDAVINSVYMGDYNHAVATQSAFHVLWADNRDDLPGGAPRKDPNVYYKKIILADPIDPSPPTNFAAYSDFSTPTSIGLTWTNPTTLINGTPIAPGDFQILISRDDSLIATRPGSDSTFTDTALITYDQYFYSILAKLIANDSTSSTVQAAWTAGGSPNPAPPVLTSLTTDTVQAVLMWTEPTTQADGTPIHDYIGTVIFRNGVAVDSVASGVTMYTDNPPLGFSYSYSLKARNSLTPRRYSVASNSLSGYVGNIPNILIWQPADVVSSDGDSIAASLTRIGEGNYLSDDLFFFGSNLSVYEAIFVVTGIFSNNHVIGASDPEGAALDAYANGGGFLYLQGGDVFNYDPEQGGYQVRPIFGLNDGSDGQSGGDVSGVTGQTLLNGLIYSYTGGNSYMDELHPNSGGGARVLFTAPGSTPANDTMAVFNFYGAGRAIAMVPEFSGLVDGPVNSVASTKDSVLVRMLRFFRQPQSPPQISVNPLAIGDTLQVAQQGSKTFTISNLTAPPSDPLFVGVSEGAPWLSVAPTADTLNGGESVVVTASFDATGLTPGNYSTNIIVASNDGTTPTINVATSLLVIGSPTIVTVPDSLIKSMNAGTMDADTLTIKNTGVSPLNWSMSDIPGSAISRIYVRQPQADEIYPPRLGRDGWPIAQGKNDPDIHHGPNRVNGFGGPDSAGYRWIDSDEPGGPTFNWVDISSIGTAIPVGAWRSSTGGANADDGYVRLKLPWPFTFYGVTYTDSLKVVTNGWQSLDQTSTNTAFSNVAIPATGEPNTFIGPWWDDLDLRTAGAVHYYTDVANNRFIVQYTNVPHFSTGELYTFQTILYANGTILYQYLDMQSLLTSATIGIENQGGTVGLQVVFNAAYMHNNLAISIANDVAWLSESPTSGTVAPGDSVKVEVIFDAVSLTAGTYRATLEINSNDYANTPKNVPVVLTVIGGVATINVTAPNGGEQWVRGNSYQIGWAQNLVDSVRIEYSVSGNAGPWRLITAGAPARPGVSIHPKYLAKQIEGGVTPDLAGTYSWQIPDTVTTTTNAFVRVSDKANLSLNDVSNAAFSIVAAPQGDTSWVLQTSGSTSTLYSVKAVSDNIAWVAGTAGTVLRTTNGGTNWTSVGGGAIGAADVYAIEAVDANTAFVTTSPGGTFIYRTTNGGSTWAAVYNNTDAAAFVDGIKMVDANNGYAQGDPVATKWMVLQTTDGGATWARMATEPAQVGAEAGWNNSFKIVGNNMWFGTNSSKIYRSTDLGLTWSSAPTTSASSYGVWFNNSTSGIAGFAGGVTNNSVNGGTSWAASASAGTGQVTGAAGVAGAEFWVTSGTNIYYTTNQGTNWTNSGSSGYTGTVSLWAINTTSVSGGTYGWAAGATGRILRYRRTSTSVAISQEIPAEFTLSQNYPNPFNPSTQIVYGLPEEASVVLRIFNVLGQEVATLVDEIQQAGFHSQTWNGHSGLTTTLSSGIYFYRLEAKGVSGQTFTNFKKMMLLK
ncbi:MAG TPA: YCF48-related protein, partial [Bacteroidota bacterium]